VTRDASRNGGNVGLYCAWRMRSVIRTVAALIAVVAIGAVDAASGQRLVLEPLHAIPTAVAAWYAGRSHGIVVALAAAVALGVAEVAGQGLDAIAVWNICTWAAALVAFAVFVSAARARREQVTALENRVAELIQIEHSFARTDQLTSLSNRRAFIDALQQAEARSRRSGGALSVARVDVDGFRALNEKYSRAEGDQLLRAIATSLSLTTRMGDLASRLENDEFAVLLYGCGPADAERVGQRLVEEIAALGRAYPEVRITASIGIACFRAPGPDPDEMMRHAGAALRRAKQAGGNTAIVERETAPSTARD
jgi:diguanylate cyclase (GGDEF)-like protein